MDGVESFARELKRGFRWILRNLRSYHAVKIAFHSSESLNENTTVFMSKADYCDIDNYDDYVTFSDTIEFKGNTVNLFIPEYMMAQQGNYCLSCKLNTNTGLHFTLVVTQHKCSFWEEKNGTWDTDGCRVSSESNINSTVCLCNHLTAFTAEYTIGTKEKDDDQIKP
ncbi:polycystin-1-related protein-like [Ptychodera flava]|uniref:polycystin-1-related protein-like n=1 Tax=Ptychodera flava TaxID=63121 RepID=UPI00396A467D